MKAKLTYEEWCAKYTSSIPEDLRQSVKQLHNVDIDEELDAVNRKEYELYLNSVKTMKELLAENWKSYVGYQICPSDSNSDIGKGFILYPRFDSEGALQDLRIDKFEIECTLTFDEMIDKIEELFLSFPTLQCLTNSSREISVARAKNMIAQLSKRGAGNVEVGNVITYKGSHESDASIVVLEHNGLYGVKKNPHFDLYGFVLVDGDN